MTNENYAILSAIRSFPLEADIYKEVLHRLIDADVDKNLIILLLNPGLVNEKQAGTLEYVMNIYARERAIILRDRKLKEYETKVQGSIEEAKLTSIPTKESIDMINGTDNDASIKAEDSAKAFTEPEEVELVKVDEDKKEVKEDAKKPEDITVGLNASNVAKKNANEITGSLSPEFDNTKKAIEKFDDKYKNDKKVEVEAPSVNVIKEEKVEKVAPKQMPKKEEVKKTTTTKPLDEKEHEVKSTREASTFFKKNKKVILIASGLAMGAVTAALFPTIITPTLMVANSILWKHAHFDGVKTVLHGLNVMLGKVSGATFKDGVWSNLAGNPLTTTLAKGGLLTVLGTYGLWGVYGVGFVNSVKNMFKALNEEEPKKVVTTVKKVEAKKPEVKEEKKEVEVKEQTITPEPIIIPEPQPEKVEAVVLPTANNEVSKTTEVSQEDFESYIKSLQDEQKEKKDKEVVEENYSVKKGM